MVVKPALRKAESRDVFGRSQKQPKMLRVQIEKGSGRRLALLRGAWVPSLIYARLPEESLRYAVFGLVLMFLVTLAGCAYALHPVTPPSQVRLKIVSPTPEVYSLRMRVREPDDYRVPTDGRVTLNVPAYRAACTIYLFGKLALPNQSDPATAKTLEISASGKTVRQLSLKTLNRLRLDADGYHLLKVPAVNNGQVLATPRTYGAPGAAWIRAIPKKPCQRVWHDGILVAIEAVDGTHASRKLTK